MTYHTLHLTMPPSGGEVFDPSLVSATPERDLGLQSSFSPNDSSDDVSSYTFSTPDSIAMRRRHGEYFHRPPVQFVPGAYLFTLQHAPPGSSQFGIETIPHGDRYDVERWVGRCQQCLAFLSDNHQCPRCEPFDEREASVSLEDGDPSEATLVDDRDEPQMGTVSASAAATNQLNVHNSLEQHMGQPIDIGLSRFWYLDQTTPEEERRVYSFYYQRKVALCTRLQFYRDIRCLPDEQWAMQEGSLVVGIEPSFAGIPHREMTDQFELRPGRFYMIAQMYADLWALCVDVSFDRGDHDPENGRTRMDIGFLPLCAVTLPANLSPFLKRCRERVNDDLEIAPRRPWNGQTVIPPRRSHSLTASFDRYREGWSLQIPPMAQEIFTNFSLLEADKSYVPLDSPLKELVVKMRNETRHLSWLRKVLSAKRRGTPSSLSTDTSTLNSSLPSTGDVSFGSNKSTDEEVRQRKSQPGLRSIYCTLGRHFARLSISKKRKMSSEVPENDC